MVITTVLTLLLSILTFSSGGPVDPVHGVSYRIQSVPHEAYLSASSHFPKPKSGLIYGKVAGDLWQGSPNQIWDVIVFEEDKNAFWFVCKAAVGNELTYMAEDTYNKTKYIENINLIEVIPISTTKSDKRIVALKSIQYGKCLQSHDFLPATYEECKQKKRTQQWVLEPVREIPNPEATHFQHRDRYGNYFLQKKTQFT